MRKLYFTTLQYTLSTENVTKSPMAKSNIVNCGRLQFICTVHCSTFVWFKQQMLQFRHCVGLILKTTAEMYAKTTKSTSVSLSPSFLAFTLTLHKDRV